MSSSLYHQHILDHAKHPRHFGLLPDANARAAAANPLCGDALEFSLRFAADGKVAAVGFTGEGCAISTAAASLLAETVPGKTVAELRALTVADMTKLLGVTLNPARLKCGTLGLEALQRALPFD